MQRRGACDGLVPNCECSQPGHGQGVKLSERESRSSVLKDPSFCAQDLGVYFNSAQDLGIYSSSGFALSRGRRQERGEAQPNLFPK